MVCNILDRHAPRKQRHIRANQKPFMNKELHMAIMHRSKLRNRYLKDKTDKNRKKCNKQRNYCVGLSRKTKQEYYENLDITKITDNKTFWKTVGPYFRERFCDAQKITLIENDDIVTEDAKTCEIFNDFFSNIVKNLNLKIDESHLTDSEHIHDPVDRAIFKYQNHPSIINIKAKVDLSQCFSFASISISEAKKQIKNLNISKASQTTDIPTKLIKDNCNIFVGLIKNCFDESLCQSVFPQDLKLADVTPVFKKDNRSDKFNYRPVSILPNLSKIFERFMYDQMYPYFESILSKFQCGFRKGFSSQHCFLVMIEKFKKARDEGGSYGALLTDLSKAVDCLVHDLLIAKLHAYGFDRKSLAYIYSYLAGRKQRTKINSTFSSWHDLIYGVPQGSILGPLLFNIYLCDFFLTIDDTYIASYADDNTPYVCDKNIETVIERLEKATSKLFMWCSSNAMKANPSKSHLLLSTKEKKYANIDNTHIENSCFEKLLGIVIDSDLKFDAHLKNICTKVSHKLNALSRSKRKAKEKIANGKFYHLAVWILSSCMDVS